MYKELREKFNLSQIEFAKKIGVQQSAISKVERGETKPNFDSLKGIYKIFGLEEVENILKRED